jgi:MFS family permease
MLATVFGIYIKTAGMSESVVGTVEGAVAFTAAVVCLIGPPLVATVGYRSLMVAAISLIVLSRLGQAAFPVAGVVIGLALAFGLGDGFMRAIGSAFMSENSSSEERTHLFSTEFVIRVLAGFLGGLLGGFMPALLRHWMPEVETYQWTITAGTSIVALGILPMLSLRDRKSREDEKFVAKTFRDSYVDAVKHFTSWRHTAKLIGPQMFISLGGGLVIPFIPLYLKHYLHVDIAAIGIIQGLASVVLGFAVFGTPVIARKFGLVRGVALCQALSVPFLALVPFAGSIVMAVMLLWSRSAVMNMAGPMYNQFSMEGVPDRDKPVVAGFMFFALNIMWMIGSMVGGRIMEFSYTAPYTIAVFMYLTGAGLTYLTWRTHDHTVGVPQMAGETA